MGPSGRKADEPKVAMAWSRDAGDASKSAFRALFSLWGKAGKKTGKDDDDDDDDLPGPNATATLFPLLTLGALGFGRIATA